MGSTDSGFQLTRLDGLTCLQSTLLNRCELIDHAFSTRLGGLSGGFLSSLNTAFHTGDKIEHVLENRRLLLNHWGYRPEEIVAGSQVHGVTVFPVAAQDRGRGAEPGTFLAEADALVTAEPGIVLTAYAADCLLLYIAEPHIPVIALAHAGWRGTLSAMAVLVVDFMQARYGVDPSHLLAAISPGICPGCYRVNEETAGRFKLAGWGGEPYLEEDGQGSYRLDLPRINAAQLINAGIAAHNLAQTGFCTSCRPDLFYSYRRERGLTGRMMGFLAIKPEKEMIA
ncbi:MAG: laccase domain-containing protein [Dethiobacter sp.]|jgi:YfiH family protein|nr:laccase domain-containing protein [Dethiobacter sp.]